MSAQVVCAASAVEQLRAAGYEPVSAMQCKAANVSASMVVVLDGLEADEVAALETLLGAEERRSIAVLMGRWNGFAALPLVAACRGIISGFGMAGVEAALRQFEEPG
jgi:hypothetical protein